MLTTTLLLSAANLWLQAIPSLPIDIVSERIMDMEAADIDGDGTPELILASEHAPNAILKLSPDGSFRPLDVLPKKPFDSEDIAVADFDNDGDLDIIFASEDNRISELYLNDGQGGFADASERLVFGTFNAVLALDVDEDGDLDLLFGAAGENKLLLNDGSGYFTDRSEKRLGAYIDVTQDIEAGDVDGDGDQDLFFANEDQNRLLLNDGRGYFTDVTKTHLPAFSDNEETREADFADLDGDGDLDLAYANVGFLTQQPATSRVLENRGNGVFKEPKKGSLLAGSEGFCLDIDFIDHDQDGDADLFFGCGFGRSLTVYENKGNFRFKPITGLKTPEVDIVDLEVFTLNGEKLLYLTNFRGADRLIRFEEAFE